MKRKSARRFRLTPVSLFLVVLVLGALGYSFWRFTPRQSADIFVITSPLEYGDVTMTGTLRKDAPVGTPGTFFLATTAGHYLELDAQGLDNLVGSSVSVTGFLSPREEGQTYPVMTVDTIQTVSAL